MEKNIFLQIFLLQSHSVPPNGLSFYHPFHSTDFISSLSLSVLTSDVSLPLPISSTDVSRPSLSSSQRNWQHEAVKSSALKTNSGQFTPRDFREPVCNEVRFQTFLLKIVMLFRKQHLFATQKSQYKHNF